MLELRDHEAPAMNKLRNTHSVIAREWTRVILNDKGKSMGDADVITTKVSIHALNLSYMWWPPSDASVVFDMSFRGSHVAHGLQFGTPVYLLIHFILTFCVFFRVLGLESHSFFKTSP